MNFLPPATQNNMQMYPITAKIQLGHMMVLYSLNEKFGLG